MLDWSMPMLGGTVDHNWKRRPFDAEFGVGASERLDAFHDSVTAAGPMGRAFFDDATVPRWDFSFKDGGIAVHPETRAAILRHLQTGLCFDVPTEMPVGAAQGGA